MDLSAGEEGSAHSAYPPRSSRVIRGEDSIGAFARTPASVRKFCRRCGGHLFPDHPRMGRVDISLNTVPTLEHRGILHVHYGEKTLAMRDGRPKFQDLPTAFGGLGIEVPE